MSNQLNKNKNKLKEKDDIRVAQENLILAQQTERRRRFQEIADGNKSTEGLLKETRQRLDLVEEAGEEFLNLHTPREENPDRRGSTHMARSAEGAWEWSELFIWDILSEQTASVDENLSLPNSVGVENSAGIENSAGVRNSAGVQDSAGVQNSVGLQNSACTQQNPQHPVIIVGSKEKFPKLDGEGVVDLIRHYKTCEMI